MLKFIPEIRKIVKSLGLVFGDIGTSPIYTLSVIFLIIKPSPENVMGIVSLIIWTLILLVNVEYAWLAMSLGKKGEGGTIVLKELLSPLLKSPKAIVFSSVLTIAGVSLLVGDGVITPAISILSAVEGILLIPGCEHISGNILILIAAIIAVVLFAFQKHGTEKVAKQFGPIMLFWFFILFTTGLISIFYYPEILRAINPYYGYSFLASNGLTGFFILSEVLLCATGGEALYADMGHLGRKPILYGWYFVFFALMVNYLGQGAFLIKHPEAKNILFSMFYSEMGVIYIPLLIVSVLATIIASQAMISGMFSIVYQGITTRIMPQLKIHFTSEEMRSQIYIGFINWFLLFGVLIIMLIFKESSHLANAYGFAVSGTMAITGFMMTWIFYLRRKYALVLLSALLTLLNIIFLISNTYKIPHGGYWSIIIALFPLLIILLYIFGQRKMHQNLLSSSFQEFFREYSELYKKNTLPGTALFFTRDHNSVSSFIVKTMIKHSIIYENNIFVFIRRTEHAFGIEAKFLNDIDFNSDRFEIPPSGLKFFDIQIGYMEVVDIETILQKSGIDGKVIFYGIEDISTHNIFWKAFSILKRVLPSFVEFYHLPVDKLQGILISIKM